MLPLFLHYIEFTASVYLLYHGFTKQVFKFDELIGVAYYGFVSLNMLNTINKILTLQGY